MLMQISMELKFTDSNCRSKTNKQSRKKKNHPTVETQTVKQQQHPVETLLFLSSRCQNETSNIPTPPFFIADLFTTDVHTNLSFHLGIFGPCFQPVFRQWKEESERF